MKPRPLPVANTEVQHLCDEAISHLDNGEPDLAFALLERALSIAPESALVHYRLALYYSDVGRIEQALVALDQSLKIDTLNAKAHNNRGSALQQLGRNSEAEVAFRRALELAPDLPPPYVNLGHILEQRGAFGDAIKVYEAAIARGLDVAMFEQYRATAAGQTTRASPESWVRETFDNFAPVFDSRLRELEYRVPELLASRLLERDAGPFDILDLGCGTGECGVALAAQKRHITGVDLSSKMLQRAKRHAIYDETHVAAIEKFLADSSASRYDVVICADVLVYIGALEHIFAEVPRVLRPGGWFAFSTEEQDDRDFALLATGRYAQSKRYIERLSAKHFSMPCADPTVIRREGGNPINGRLYLLQRLPYTRT